MTRLITALKQRIRRVLETFGYRISHVTSPTLDCFLPLLYRRLSNTQDFFFVQIGANDGRFEDPIYEFVTRNHDKVRGIVVEPLEDVFNTLKHTYRHFPNVTPVNVAIHATEKSMDLYRVDPQKLNELPKWAQGIASFDKDHHKLSNTPEDYVVRETVQCVTFNELLKDHDVSHIDLLQVDTEGYDAEILLDIDLAVTHPCIIRFEHGLADGIMNRETFSRVVEVLHKNDYAVVAEEYDATAYQLKLLTNT